MKDWVEAVNKLSHEVQLKGLESVLCWIYDNWF